MTKKISFQKMWFSLNQTFPQEKCHFPSIFLIFQLGESKWKLVSFDQNETIHEKTAILHLNIPGLELVGMFRLVKVLGRLVFPSASEWEGIFKANISRKRGQHHTGFRRKGKAN